MLAPGGSPHSQRFVNLLVESGCDVTFVDDEDPKAWGCRGHRFVPYPGFRGGRLCEALVGGRVTDGLRLRARTARLARLFRRVRPDIVHLHQVDGRAYHCARAGLKPLVLSVWGTDINQHFLPGANPEARARTGQALARAELVLADASDMVEKCAQLAGRAVRVELLPLGVNTRLFRPAEDGAGSEWRQRMDIPEGAYVFLSARALHPRYGQLDILEAFGLARPRLNALSFLVFKLYNSEGAEEYAARVRARVAELGLGGCVRWVGRVAFEQLPALYAAADVLVNYPIMDGFPVTFLEAAACQRPMVSNRLPSYAGTFAEKFFHLVEPGNIATLADALVRSQHEPSQERARRVDGARRVVEKQFDEAVVCARLLDIYRGLASRQHQTVKGRFDV